MSTGPTRIIVDEGLARRFRVARRAVLAVAAGGAALGLAGGALAQPAAVPPDDGPKVAVVTPGLDALDTFQNLGPATGTAITLGVVSAALSPLSSTPDGQAAVNQITSVLASITAPTADLSLQGSAAIEQLKAALAPLAALNPTLNPAVAQVADAFDAIASSYGKQIAPLDRVLVAEAANLRGFEAPG